MSYILDALRKADAQRSREAPRGINAQPRGPGDSASSRIRPWYWIAAAAGVGAVGWAGWSMTHPRGDATPPAPAREEIAALSPASPLAMRQESPMPGPVGVPRTAAPVVGSAVQPPPIVIPPPPPTAAQVAQVQAAPPPGWPPTGMDPRNTARPMVRGRQTGVANSGGVPEPLEAPAAPANPAPGFPPIPPGASPVAPGMEPRPMPQFPPPAGQVAPAPLPPPVAANAPPPPPVAGLPPDAPRLSISGGVYSANRAQRMLIVNGQVFSEGSEISSGVVLEEVKPKIAVLRFRGARYTVSY